MKLMPVLFFCLALGGCVSTQNVSPPILAPIAPDTVYVEKFIRDYLAKGLKDPDSLKQLTIGAPRHRRLERGWVNGGGYDEGWVVCYSYNAKNSYGAYTGVTAAAILFRPWGADWKPEAWFPNPGEC